MFGNGRMTKYLTPRSLLLFPHGISWSHDQLTQCGKLQPRGYGALNSLMVMAHWKRKFNGDAFAV